MKKLKRVILGLMAEVEEHDHEFLIVSGKSKKRYVLGGISKSLVYQDPKAVGYIAEKIAFNHKQEE